MQKKNSDLLEKVKAVKKRKVEEDENVSIYRLFQIVYPSLIIMPVCETLRLSVTVCFHGIYNVCMVFTQCNIVCYLVASCMCT